MALNAYLTLKGEKQGTIKGSETRKGLEGSIAVFAVHHQVISPRDAASGLATGKRQHHPLVINKAIDKSSPLLMNALITNENITEVIIKFFSPNTGASGGRSGLEVQHYTIKLTNARIVHIEMDMENNLMEPGNKLPILEYVGFTYQKIEWTYTDGGIMATDSWIEGKPKSTRTKATNK